MTGFKKQHIFLLLAFLFAMGANTYSQSRIDSLKQQLSSVKGQDKYAVLAKLFTEHIYIDADQALKYAEEALGIATTLNDEKRIADSYYNLGFANYRKADYPVAIKNFNIALEMYIKQKNERSEANVKNFLAIVNMEMKRSDIALQLYTELLQYYSGINQLSDYSIILMNIGTILLEKQEYDKALDSFSKVLDMMEKNNIVNKDFTANVYCNIGEAYFGKKQYDQSLKYQKMSLELFKETKLDDGIANLQMDIGLSLIKLKEYSQAKEFLTDGLKNYELIKYAPGIRNTKERFIQLYTETRQFDKALETLRELEELSIAGKDSNMISKCYKMYADVYSSTGNSSLAYNYLKKHIDLKTLIDSRENKQRIMELQTVFAIDEKEFENKTLKKENELQREKLNGQRIIVTIVLVALILFALLIAMLFRKEKNLRKSALLLEKKNEEINIQNKKLEEIILVKDKFFSILAHNLKNPFWSILGQNSLLEQSYNEFTDEERKELISRIGTLAANVYKLFEDLLSWAKTQQGAIEVAKNNISLSELINSAVKPYLAQAQNKQIDLEINTDVQMSINADKFMMETVIGNIVDNAIKFSNRHGRVQINTLFNNGNVEISIKDQGTGMDKEKVDKLFKISENISSAGTMNEKGTGLGLIICKEFTEIHEGSIKVESEEGNYFYYSTAAKLKTHYRINRIMIRRIFTLFIIS